MSNLPSKWEVKVTGTRVGTERRCCCFVNTSFIVYDIELARLPYREGEAIEVKDATSVGAAAFGAVGLGAAWTAGTVVKGKSNKVAGVDGVYTVRIADGPGGELTGIVGSRLRLPGGGVREGEAWAVEKRFSELRDFDQCLRRKYAHVPPLPKRGIIGKGLRDNRDPSFRYQRQAAFHFYLERVLGLNHIERSEHFLQFFKVQQKETDRLVGWTYPSALEMDA
jgi:hypothetical protein